MGKQYIRYMIIIAAAVAAFACYWTVASDAADNFWTTAAQSGKAEVAQGELAMKMGQSAAVREYGKMIVDDHTKANSELMSLAVKKSVTLPADMSAAELADVNKLKGLTGAAFDIEFSRQMVKDHEAAVALFTKASNSNPDADVKAWAAKTLPSLEMHLSMSRSLTNKGPMTTMTNSSTMDHSSMSTGSSNANSKTKTKTKGSSNSNR